MGPRSKPWQANDRRPVGVLRAEDGTEPRQQVPNSNFAVTEREVREFILECGLFEVDGRDAVGTSWAGLTRSPVQVMFGRQ